MSYYHDNSGGGAAAGLVGLVLVMYLVLLLVLIGIVVMLTNLVIRTFVRYGRKSRALWVWLFVWFGLGLATAGAAAYADTQIPPDPFFLDVSVGAGGLFVLATAGLLITCRAVEIRYEPFFQPERETGVQAVLRRPWWQPLNE